MGNITLKISKKEILRRIGDICQTILVIGLIFFFLTHFQSEIGIMFILMAIGTLPSIILLIEYLNCTLKIDEADFTPEYINIVYKKTAETRILYTDIKVIILYKSASKDKGSFTIFINEDYYFAAIITKTHQKIALTSLFGPALNDALDMIKDVSMIREKTGYAYVFKMND